MTTSNLVSANSGPVSAKPSSGAGAKRGSALDALSTWYGNGERITFDSNLGAMSGSELRVFIRREGDISHAVTFLPGYPDGSSGWANVLPHLPDASAMPKLFLDYVGMGDSDKPKTYRFSTAERADLVEALWRNLGVRTTTLIAFDFSSLVVLEHLRRRLERAEATGGPEISRRFHLQRRPVHRRALASVVDDAGATSVARLDGTGIRDAVLRHVHDAGRCDVVAALRRPDGSGASGLRIAAPSRRVLLSQPGGRVRGRP